MVDFGAMPTFRPVFLVDALFLGIDQFSTKDFGRFPARVYKLPISSCFSQSPIESPRGNFHVKLS